MLGNPEYFTIEECKALGMWPMTFLPVYGMLPYIRRLGEKIQGIEIGVLKGENVFTLLEECPNIECIYGIDPYKAYQDIDMFRNQEEMDQYREVAKTNLAICNGRYHHIDKYSSDAVDEFFDETIDFILIDADQTTGSVYEDLVRYYPKLKKRGIIFGHDNNIEAVMKGVKLFREHHKIRLPINQSKNFVWFWSKV